MKTLPGLLIYTTSNTHGTCRWPSYLFSVNNGPQISYPPPNCFPHSSLALFYIHKVDANLRSKIYPLTAGSKIIRLLAPALTKSLLFTLSTKGHLLFMVITVYCSPRVSCGQQVLGREGVISVHRSVSFIAF